MAGSEIVAELWNDHRYSTEFSLLGSDMLQIAKPD